MQFWYISMKIVSLINLAKDIATTLNIQIHPRRIIEKYLKKGLCRRKSENPWLSLGRTQYCSRLTAVSYNPLTSQPNNLTALNTQFNRIQNYFLFKYQKGVEVLFVFYTTPAPNWNIWHSLVVVLLSHSKDTFLFS